MKIDKNLKTKILALIPLFIILCYLPISSAYAGTSNPSVLDIQQQNINVQMKIEFNATTLTGIPVQKSITRGISVPLKLGKQSLLPLNYKSTSTNEYTGDLYAARTYSVYSKNIYDIISEGTLMRENATIRRNYVTLMKNTTRPTVNRTYEFDITKNFLARNMTEITNQSLTTHSGIMLQAIIPDAKSIASDYCRKNNLILGTIQNESCIITEKSEGVDTLIHTRSVEMQVDPNLDDGYAAIPVNASFGFTAAVGIGIAAFLIILAIGGAIGLATGNWNPLDFSKTYIEGDTYYYENTTYNIDLPDNDSTYDNYLDLCNRTEIEPTAEGYSKFLRDYYGAIGDAMPNPTHNVNLNNNRSVDFGNSGSANIFTAFIESLIPIIMIIIIIIAVILSILFVVKIYQKYK